MFSAGLQTLCSLFWLNANWLLLSLVKEYLCIPCQVNLNTAEFTISTCYIFCLKSWLANKPGFSTSDFILFHWDHSKFIKPLGFSFGKCRCYTTKNCSASAGVGISDIPFIADAGLPPEWNQILVPCLKDFNDFYTRLLITFKGIQKSLLWIGSPS